MPTNNDAFKPQPHDPRWKSALANPPRKEDYPIWIDARDYVGTTDGHYIRLWEHNRIDRSDPWSYRTLWLSDKEARSPIPCDAHPPVEPCWRFDPVRQEWFTGRSALGPSHWFPYKEKAGCPDIGSFPPREPRFPEGNPPAGYRWLGEGETVKEGDQYLFRGLRQVVEGLVSFKVGTFDCDYDSSPYFRPLYKPAAPPIVECRGSSDDLPPPAGLAAFEDSLDELHDKVDDLSPKLAGDFENVFERLAAVERKLDRLLSHLGAHKPEV